MTYAIALRDKDPAVLYGETVRGIAARVVARGKADARSLDLIGPPSIESTVHESGRAVDVRASFDIRGVGPMMVVGRHFATPEGGYHEVGCGCVGAGCSEAFCSLQPPPADVLPIEQPLHFEREPVSFSVGEGAVAAAAHPSATAPSAEQHRAAMGEEHALDPRLSAVDVAWRESPSLGRAAIAQRSWCAEQPCSVSVVAESLRDQVRAVGVTLEIEPQLSQSVSTLNGRDEHWIEARFAHRGWERHVLWSDAGVVHGMTCSCTGQACAVVEQACAFAGRTPP